MNKRQTVARTFTIASQNVNIVFMVGNKVVDMYYDVDVSI